MTDNEKDDITIYQAFRGQLEHEDNLINQRVSWLVGSQSFLFVPYVLLVTAAPNTPIGEILALKNELSMVIVSIGILSCLAIGFGIYAALEARRIIMERYRSLGIRIPTMPELIPGQSATRLSLAAPFGIIWVVISAWLSLMELDLFYKTLNAFAPIFTFLAVGTATAAFVRVYCWNWPD